MTDQTPQLSQNASEPKGVIRKNIKMFVYLGAILLLITASLFSSRKKTPNGTPAKGMPPQARIHAYVLDHLIGSPR